MSSLLVDVKLMSVLNRAINDILACTHCEQLQLALRFCHHASLGRS